LLNKNKALKEPESLPKSNNTSEIKMKENKHFKLEKTGSNYNNRNKQKSRK